MNTNRKSRRWPAIAAVIPVLFGCVNGESATETRGKDMMSLDEKIFGQMPDGAPVRIYTLKNQNGVVVKITEYGAIITEIHAPDRQGKTGDVVLGFDNLDRYRRGHPFFGAIAGRVANRIANGRFTLEGKEYTLAKNNGPNHLHGGLKGFDKKVWTSKPISTWPVPAISSVTNCGSPPTITRPRTKD